MFLALLNTSILTAHGQFSFQPCTLEVARDLISEAAADAADETPGLRDGWVSYIGHESTAEILSELLRVSVPVSRIAYSQQVGDFALVFKLRARAPEGKILSRKEIEAIGYEFGVLTRSA